MKKNRILIVVGLLLGYLLSFGHSHQIPIIPAPEKVTKQNGNFILNTKTQISFSNGKNNLTNEVNNLQSQIQNKLDFEIKISQNKSLKNKILLYIDKKNEKPESYSLTISQSHIEIKAGDNAGLFYGIQTFMQLIPQKHNNSNSYKLPCLKIQDSPRYGYRGLMLDPARHFLPIKDLKKYIDAISFYKFNILHLHLTDDQGWRVEIKGYPKLTEIGSKRAETDGDGRVHQGFYTQKELKELVKYAEKRHITILPEIDLPGHVMSVMASYPELACFPKEFKVRTIPGVSKNLLCAGNPNVYKFIEAVIAQIADIFPYKHIHIGGDEAPTDMWEKCKHCQKIIKDKHLEDEHELMAHFFGKVHKILAKYGKTPQLWFESTVKGYPKGSQVYLWRNEEPDVKIKEIQAQGLDMINCYGRNAYFDYPQWQGDIPKQNWMPILTLKDAYQMNPTRDIENADFVKGVQACIWGEYIPNIDRAFYMTFPRAMALAEAGWSMEKNRDWNTFLSKLEQHLSMLLKKGINYRVPHELYHK